ncbi:MAG: hypothetical protein DRI90_06715 [Deltaproteobacteria bacterium]|nr:MAG: hypothetical protein DRI90_06715 [Deltaproteobacteria bacterium]
MGEAANLSCYGARKMDTHTEVATTGWFSRIASSIKSVLLGLLLFAGAFPLLWWNEGRVVRVAESLDEGAGVVASVAADAVETENDGELVHLSGLARTEDVLKDADFGVSETGLKLIRSVDMYQWTESVERNKKKKTGGKEETRTTYRYQRSWSSTPIDSSRFSDSQGHGNPPMRYQEVTRLAPNVTVGAFTLPPELVSKISGAAIVPMDEAAHGKLTPTIQQRTRVHEGAFHYRPTAVDGTFNAAQPEVGDHRIRFSVLKAAEVSIVAKQTGSSLAAYQTKGGDDLLMLLGLGLVFRPLVVVADVVPLLGELLRIGAFFVALAISLPLSILTIAIAWLTARPLMGAALLVVFVGIITGLVLLIRKRKAKRTAVATADPQFLRPTG